MNPQDGRSRTVIVVAHSWPPDANVGAVRPVHLCRQLLALGWQPVVVTVKESSYEHLNDEPIRDLDSIIVIRASEIPSPRLAYIWLKRLVARCIPSKRRKRAHSSSSGERFAGGEYPKSLWKRTLLSLLYTPDEFQGWLPTALPKTLAAVRKYRPVCIVSTAPPYTSHLVALWVKRLTGVPFIADYRDPWTWRDGFAELFKLVPAPIRRFNERLEGDVLRGADRIVCVTESMRSKYRETFPDIPAEKWATIYNGFDLSEFQELGEVLPFERFTVSHVGGFDFERSPRPVLEAVAQLIADGVVDRRRIALRFIGPSQQAAGERLSTIISELQLQDVAQIVGLLPRTAAMKEMLGSSALLLLGGQQRLTVAAKLFEYMAAGKPIVAVTQEGEAAELVRRTGRGHVLAPSDAIGLKAALATLYLTFQDGGQQVSTGLSDAVLEYNWSRLGAEYARLIEGLAVLV